MAEGILGLEAAAEGLAREAAEDRAEVVDGAVAPQLVAAQGAVLVGAEALHHRPVGAVLRHRIAQRAAPRRFHEHLHRRVRRGLAGPCAGGVIVERLGGGAPRCDPPRLVRREAPAGGGLGMLPPLRALVPHLAVADEVQEGVLDHHRRCRHSDAGGELPCPGAVEHVAVAHASAGHVRSNHGAHGSAPLGHRRRPTTRVCALKWDTRKGSGSDCLPCCLKS
mmetsp:Transcript_26484/g.76518  ORF Transcript_26484/g.76518 Transcript_26484/m.76518 type:complete len:222 (-) Transcript_26484:31-696(-)